MTKKTRSKLTTGKRHGQDRILKTRRIVRISHHRHSGKYLPIEYTSYAVIFFLLVFTGFVIFFVKNHLVEAGPPQTQSGSVQITGIVPGAPPTNPAAITSPTEGQRFQSSTISVQGTCDNGLIVEIYRNDALAGSAVCGGSGEYQLSVTLVAGENKLKARIHDSINQYGPDSAVVTVYYDVPSAETIQANSSQKISTSQAQIIREIRISQPLLVYAKPLQATPDPSQRLTLRYKINGGRVPYAVSVEWGDGKNTVISLSEEGEATLQHEYKRAGQYKVKISITDKNESEAVVEVIVVVNGEANPALGTTCASTFDSPSCIVTNRLQNVVDILWPAFLITLLMTLSFGLGERVVYTKITKRAQRT